MTKPGISLGWNCSAAQDGVRLGLRDTKTNGYKTCPFDIMVSNYIGVCKCISDNFKYFCDPNCLKLKEAPKMARHFPNQNDNEMWIYNTYYNFVFNHESPFHGDLYLKEHWSSPYHFVENNFENFIKRYNTRIDNFKNYLNTSEYVNFILWRYNSTPLELSNTLKLKFPLLKFKINSITNFGPHTTNSLINKHTLGAKEYEIDYLKYMNIHESDYPQEYSRYHTEFNGLDKDIEINENIILIDPKNDIHLNDANYLR